MHSFFCIPLGCIGGSPNRHHAIAHVFINVTTCLLDHRIQPGPKFLDQITYSFKIQLLGKQCESLHICEQDGGRASLFREKVRRHDLLTYLDRLFFENAKQRREQLFLA